MSPLAQILAQASRPTALPPPVTVQPTPVASIYANNDAQKMDAYKAQLAQQNAQFGGLASLGSAGISVLPKLLPAAGTAAAGAGGTDALATILPFMIA